MKAKRCTKCNGIFPGNEFGKCHYLSSGLTSQCKICLYASSYKHRTESEAFDFNGIDWDICRAYWNYSCCVCGSKSDKLTVDHWVSLNSKDTSGHVRWNVIPLCSHCNSSKNNTPADVWLAKKYDPLKAALIYTEIESYLTLMNELRSTTA